jgi:type I restriction enzyme R subunit
VVKVLTDFILFTRQDDELKKVVLRQHQMRAVDKLIERASAIEKKRGLVWHTQGSGKTYTMIVAAQKIIENPIFENPTVIMLVDEAHRTTGGKLGNYLLGALPNATYIGFTGTPIDKTA